MDGIDNGDVGEIQRPRLNILGKDHGISFSRNKITVFIGIVALPSSADIP